MRLEARKYLYDVREAADLAVKNHSAAFWAHLAVVIPDYMARRRRLRELGPFLSLP